MRNPEMVDVAEFAVYRNFPFGVTTCQQVAAPAVGMLTLMGTSVPFGARAYDETAEVLPGVPGPVSEVIAKPFGANTTANSPGPALGVLTAGPSVPFGLIGNASNWFVAFSVTRRKRLSGEIASDPAR